MKTSEAKTNLFDGTWDQYRNTPLRKDTHNYPLGMYVSYVNRGDINMNPPYQRGLVWTLEQKRRLINSIVIGLSLPAVYIRETDIGAEGAFLEMVDGKQRISTLLEFIDNEWGYDGKFFRDLKVPFQRSFKDTLVPTVRVSGLTDAETLELYERLNFGGVPHKRG